MPATEKQIFCRIHTWHSSNGGIDMNRNLIKKHILIAFKMVFILLVFNLSNLFAFGQTEAAIVSSTGQSVVKNVIDLPEENDPAGNISEGSPIHNENETDMTDTDEGNRHPDGLPDTQYDPDREPTPAPDPDSVSDPKKGLVQPELDRIYHHEGEKTAYLTFDDGPTPPLTSAILDILKAEGIKATFFSIGSNAKRYPDMIRKEYEEGHGIGIHTYSHRFEQIYSSPEKYLEEVRYTEQVLKSILGEDKEFKLTRFPGGSFGEKLTPYRKAVNEAGYVYVDWNSLNGDAEIRKTRSAKQLIERLKETVYGQSGLVVLMHDAPKKQSTVEALPEIIRYLKSENYRFELISGSR